MSLPAATTSCARDPGIPRYMKDVGVGLVGLANRHMMDYTLARRRIALLPFSDVVPRTHAVTETHLRIASARGEPHLSGAIRRARRAAGRKPAGRD